MFFSRVCRQELVLHERSDVSSRASAVLERVIRSDGASARRATRLIRSAVPRLVRLAGPPDPRHADGSRRLHYSLRTTRPRPILLRS